MRISPTKDHQNGLSRGMGQLQQLWGGSFPEGTIHSQVIPPQGPKPLGTHTLNTRAMT